MKDGSGARLLPLAQLSLAEGPLGTKSNQALNGGEKLVPLFGEVFRPVKQLVLSHPRRVFDAQHCWCALITKENRETLTTVPAFARLPPDFVTSQLLPLKLTLQESLPDWLTVQPISGPGKALHRMERVPELVSEIQ